MQNFLRHLRAAWNYGRYFPYNEGANAESFWTREDAIATANFFNSYTGKKLSMRLSNYVVTSAQAAVTTCDPYRNGVAAGIPMAITAIEAHYPQEEEETQAETTNLFETIEA